MIRGLYTSSSGMAAQLAAQEVISNNLANVDTIAYKKDFAVNGTFSSLLLSRIGDNSDRGMNPVIGKLGTGAALKGTYTNFTAGTLKFTENKLDLAIGSEGFFVLETPQGERYTRDGSFAIASNGDLVNKDGFGVMGDQGIVNIGGAEDLHFSSDGTVAADGRVINRLRIVNASDPQMLRKEGNNLFALREGGEVGDIADFSVFQGYLESSNVNAVSEMVNMINGFRIYEAAQRSIHFQDGTLDRLINDFGRV